MTMDVNQPINYLMRYYRLQGVHDLDQLSDRLHSQKIAQNQQGFYPYDRYCHKGPGSQAKIITEFSLESQDCIVWCTNHYLGLNRHPEVISKVQKAIGKFGTGCGTSAVSGGMNSLHKEIESRISAMLNKERTILFPTGYSTNLGALSALLTSKDIAIFDHESHASIIDGIRLSGCRFASFKHNNIENLERQLQKFQGKYENTMVILESAYSMSGDLAPLKEIVALKKKYKFFLYVDEAHTFGIFGDQGSGYCRSLGLTDEVDFIMSTLSKSTASIGGFVATKAKFCTLIQHAASSYAFQACLPPADATAILTSLEVIRNQPELLTDLHQKNQYMRAKLANFGFDLGTSQSPIIPIYISDLEKLNKISTELYRQGIFSVAITPPAVKLTEGRLRFIVNASHTYDQIDLTVNVLKSLAKKYQLFTDNQEFGLTNEDTPKIKKE